MESIKRQDSKLRNWLKFSLTAARKDKRKRKKVYLASYFEYLVETWANTLENREIKLNIELNGNDDLALKVFEIDLDSIFNNLIVNSIDAFITNTSIIERKIFIQLSHNDREINIEYQDNGPGLSPDIDKPDKIFDALYTTKGINIHLRKKEQA
ncbi:ATP-binding protein [Sphingobacterium sp. E70]|uniref:ATP-binding protein n=1 Tax=Sphingobacterium sp. E70 TaxID=2853439 RepID=UPI00211C8B72|nr:ATP-binding protein [Sphingobacterium sp. E70]ULT25753.1 ATP-binding protein [Sphingobacterium sp. E70]